VTTRTAMLISGLCALALLLALCAVMWWAP